MMSESYRLLAVPEMVANILQAVTKNCSLFACAQVDKLWAQEATTWRHKPRILSLAALDTPARLQHYAKQIYYLAVRNKDEAKLFSMFP